jgi:hypothetical protein
LNFQLIDEFDPLKASFEKNGSATPTSISWLFYSLLHRMYGEYSHPNNDEILDSQSKQWRRTVIADGVRSPLLTTI